MDRLRGGLIVSCQAETGTPLGAPGVLAALAAAAVRGGAAGIRANGPDNIAAITRAVDVPVIAIYKVVSPGSEVYITPTFEDARAVHAAGDPPPAIVAFDATGRRRCDAGEWRTLLGRIRNDLGALAMADVSTHAEGIAAAEAGADIVATTLSGYTAETAGKRSGGPDLELVRSLATAGVTVICEGRIHTPQLARDALSAGAFAVVVGTAITAIDWVTRNYVDRIHNQA